MLTPVILAKRLSEKQKEFIIKDFTAGNNVESLSIKFNCSQLTIIRNLKKILGELKYKELVKRDKNITPVNSRKNNNIKNILKDNGINKKASYKESEGLENFNENKSKTEFFPIESFLEIAPLDYEIDNTSRKELSSVPIKDIDFPRIVYMIVNKNIELEIKLLKDYPSWEFLPTEDLNRKTIEIYNDLKTAKRICSKEQKVIKVPNTDVFRIVSPILISRGISRIVYSEKLIAL